MVAVQKWIRKEEIVAHLYKSPKGGYLIKNSSYSAGQDFRKCPKYFEYRKIQGWSEKRNGPEMALGNCVEAAVQYYHTKGGQAGLGVDEFKRRWLMEKGKDYDFNDKTGDWAATYQSGSELLALYEILWPSFGYTELEFQKKYQKLLWPGDENLGDLGFMGYVDMLVGNGCGDSLVIDIKVSGSDFDVDPRLLSLDPQLRSYAWLTGIPDVAFLWFHRVKPGAFKKGDEVTILQTNLNRDTNPAGVQAGDSAFVLSSTDTASVLLNFGRFEEYEKAAKGVTGNALKALKASYDPHTLTLVNESLTKQSVKFIRTRISEEDMREAGESIGQEVAQLERASRTGHYPKKPGVRYPENLCLSCSMLPLCIGDDKARDETLINPYTTKTPVPASKAVDEDWIEEL